MFASSSSHEGVRGLRPFFTEEAVERCSPYPRTPGSGSSQLQETMGSSGSLNRIPQKSSVHILKCQPCPFGEVATRPQGFCAYETGLVRDETCSKDQVHMGCL